MRLLAAVVVVASLGTSASAQAAVLTESDVLAELTADHPAVAESVASLARAAVSSFPPPIPGSPEALSP